MSLPLAKTITLSLDIHLRMSSISTIRTIHLRTNLIPFTNFISRTFAEDSPSSVRKASKLSASDNKMKEFPVETNPFKLVEYCCGSNIYKEGEDVKLKPESEYPDWLWTLNTGPPPKLHEMDPNTKEYWILARKLAQMNQQRLVRIKLLRMKYANREDKKK